MVEAGKPHEGSVFVPQVHHSAHLPLCGVDTIVGSVIPVDFGVNADTVTVVAEVELTERLAVVRQRHRVAYEDGPRPVATTGHLDRIGGRGQGHAAGEDTAADNGCSDGFADAHDSSPSGFVA